MAKGDIFIDTKQINQVTIGLKSLEKQMPGAAASAINRTVDYVNTKLARIVVAEYAIKTSDVKNTIKKSKASKSNLSASLTSRGHTLSMSHFPFTPKQPGIKRAVKVKIKKSAGVKTINTDPTAFVQVMKNSLNVFKRVGKERKPVVVIRTLSVPQMISNEKVEREIQQEAGKKIAERIQHEIEYRLNKIKVK
jgi:hypothetical protein